MHNPGMPAFFDKLTTAAKVLPVVAVIAFFMSFATHSTQTVNGRVTQCSYTDFLALAVGVACLIGGASILRRGARPRTGPEEAVTKWHLGIGAAVAVLGVVHLLRGLGILWGPC